MSLDSILNSEPAHVRWLLLGPTSVTPNASGISINRADFNEVFAAQKLSASANIAQAVGGTGDVAVHLSFSKLRDFTLKQVLTNVPVLQKLRALAESLGGASSKRPSTEDTLATIKTVIGEGPLHHELSSLFLPAATDSTNSTELTGELLNSARASQKSPESQAVDSFVGAMRRNKKNETSSPSASATFRRARDIIETAVFLGANAILAAPEVTSLESTWRGIKTVVDEAGSGNIAIELIDVTSENLPGKLADRIRAAQSEIDLPDAVFIFAKLTSIQQVGELADIGEAANVPIVFDASLDVLGSEHDSLSALSEQVEEHQSSPAQILGDDWTKLRESSASRWVAGVTNAYVSQAEGAGDARRCVLSSPVFAFAGLLSSSFVNTGGFARILGRNGALRSGGTIEVSSTTRGTISAPTQEFVAIRTQSLLNDIGLLALGSPRNSDQITLAAMPTVSGAKDAFPVAAQMLTGRLVRFAQWMLAQIPAGLESSDLTTMFTDASTVFLFPGLPENRAKLDANVVDDGKTIRLIASVHPEFAGIPFEVGFDLPLE